MAKKVMVTAGTVSVNHEVYTEGEEIPAGVLTKKQVADLEGVGVIEQVEDKSDKPEKKEDKGKEVK